MEINFDKERVVCVRACCCREREADAFSRVALNRFSRLLVNKFLSSGGCAPNPIGRNLRKRPESEFCVLSTANGPWRARSQKALRNARMNLLFEYQGE